MREVVEKRGKAIVSALVLCVLVTSLAGCGSSSRHKESRYTPEELEAAHELYEIRESLNESK